VKYTHVESKPDHWHIHAGRLYEGLPYSYSGATPAVWLDHPHTVDEKGIHNMQGIKKELLHGRSVYARMGIDCSGTVNRAWQSVGAHVRTESASDMTPDNGYLRVGEYEAPMDNFVCTKDDCANNGLEVMCKAYAQLQKGDGIVTQNKSGHARFVVGVEVVRNEDGSIDAEQSKVTVIEQNGRLSKEIFHFDETLGENVYECITVDQEYTFAKLYETGYLPLTNKIFIDPSPIADPVVTDSVKEPNISNLFSGTLECNWALDNVTFTITDASGAVVQSAILHVMRRTELAVNMAQYTADAAEGKTVGVLDLDALAAGSYRCKVTCRTVGGHILPVREFDFTV